MRSGGYNWVMGPMAIRARWAQTNQRFVALLAVLVLACSVVVHHSGATHEMGGMHGGDHSMAATAMCVGTIAATVAIVGLVAAVVRRRRTVPRPLRALLPAVVRIVPAGPLPRARSSPLYLQYEVLRR